MNLRISVVIPVYNKAAFLERAVDSVLRQARPADEVIIVDDGSTDGSWQIATRYRLAGVHVVGQANAGPGAARNRGAELATGDLLAFLDADDEWLPNYLCEMEREFQADPTLAVACAGYIEEPPGYFRKERLKRQQLVDGIQEIDASTPPDQLSWRAIFMWTCTTIARRNVFRRWGGFYDRDRCRYAEDQVLWLKWLLNERVRFVMKPFAIYHRSASDLNSHRNGPRALEPFLLHPELLTDCCPSYLRALVDRFLAVRAMRAANMLGYWGHTAEARSLLPRFASAGDLAGVRGVAALVACTPLGPWLGRLALSTLRRMRRDEVAHVQTAPGPRLAMAPAALAAAGPNTRLTAQAPRAAAKAAGR